MKLMVKTACFISAFFQILLILAETAVATPSTATAPKEPGDQKSAISLIINQKSPIIIDTISLRRYESAFIPSLAEKIAEHDLVVKTQSLAPQNFRFDSAWINLSLKGGTRTLHENTATAKAIRGPAFGSFDVIQAEESENRIKAFKLLWNIIAVQEANQFIDHEATLSWMRRQKLEAQKIKTRLVTLYPAAIVPDEVVAFRQRLQITEGDNWLSAFNLLTLRQYGNKDDLFWMFSPTLNSARELAGSLRGDNIVQSLISLDDISLFSGKPELTEPEVYSTFRTLVPFVSESAMSSKADVKNSDCLGYISKKIENTNPLGEFFFVPRKVFSLKLTQRDPYSLTGRQILYVDAETMLPFLKEVYSQDGKLLKLVLGAFELFVKEVPALKNSFKEEVHFAPHSIIAFGDQSSLSILRTESTRICSKLPEDLSEQYFDPSALGEKISREQG